MLYWEIAGNSIDSVSSGKRGGGMSKRNAWGVGNNGRMGGDGVRSLVPRQARVREA